MGLFNKKEQKIESYCEYEEININRFALSRNNEQRKVQLGALFTLFKNKYKDAEYSIETTIKEFEIPEEFESPEILAISKYFEVKEWHIFIDEEHYIDIDFDFIKVNGELDMIDFCKDAILKIEKYKSTIDVCEFSFHRYSDWLWDKYIESQYDICVKMGNRYFKYGDFYVYDEDLDEFKITCKEDFNKMKRIKYILLKSKLNTYKVIFIDEHLRQVIATEFDDLEKEYLKDLLHPEIEE